MNKRLLGALVVFIFILAVGFLLPVKQWLLSFLSWTALNKGLAIVIFILVYISACVLMLPGIILTVGAGFVFGVVEGFLLVSVGSTLGASCAFFIGRYFARSWVNEKVSVIPRFKKIDKAMQGKDWQIVLLTRLSPLFPFNILNYAYGLTSVRPLSYVLASWIGMMPGTLLYVYIGSAAENMSEAFNPDGGGPSQLILMVLGLLATLGVTVIITRIATQSLDEKIS